MPIQEYRAEETVLPTAQKKIKQQRGTSLLSKIETRIEQKDSYSH